MGCLKAIDMSHNTEYSFEALCEFVSARSLSVLILREIVSACIFMFLGINIIIIYLICKIYI